MAISPWIWVAAAAAGAYAIRQRRKAKTQAPSSTSGNKLVVFFHAWGGKDSTYQEILDPLLKPLGVPYILPHGTPVGGGRHRWWQGESNTSDAYAQGVAAAVAKVKPELEALKASGKQLLLAGHSQGAQMAATLAMQGVAPAVVAAGWVPAPLVTTTPQPIVFVNGTEDPHTIYARTEEMVDALNNQGVSQVDLIPVVGAGHEFTGPLQEVWAYELQQAVKR